MACPVCALKEGQNKDNAIAFSEALKAEQKDADRDVTDAGANSDTAAKK